MGQLGTKIVEDIKAKFNSGDFTNKVVSEAGNIHVRSIKRLSKAGKDASGTDFFPLNQSYAEHKQGKGGSGEADLYSGKNKSHALDDMFDDAIDQEFGVEFGNADQEDYMGAHQIGGQAKKDFAQMPVRKWFPTEEDKNSGPQKKNIEAIEQVLEKYMNEDRIIRVKTRIT